MLKHIITITALSLISFILISCGGNSEADDKEAAAKNESAKAKTVENRWYNTAQLMRGKRVFKENCAVCHGDKGQGLTENWKVAQADGKYPAPPLNGSAHAWHHSKEILKRTVNNGGIALGGTMPSFKDKLTEEEKEAVLAHVMSLWPDKIYQAWNKRNPL